MARIRSRIVGARQNSHSHSQPYRCDRGALSLKFGWSEAVATLWPFKLCPFHQHEPAHEVSTVQHAVDKPERPSDSVHELFTWAFQEFNVNRACFPKEKHQNSQKSPKFMNFSFWPFLWFGLPGRLLRFSSLSDTNVGPRGTTLPEAP